MSRRSNSWAQSREQERAPIQIPLYVAGRRVNLLLASSGCAPDCTRRPAPRVLRLGFGAWRIACDKNKPAALEKLAAQTPEAAAKSFVAPVRQDVLN